jgi:hypothetical protein
MFIVMISFGGYPCRSANCNKNTIPDSDHSLGSWGSWKDLGIGFVGLDELGPMGMRSREVRSMLQHKTEPLHKLACKKMIAMVAAEFPSVRFDFYHIHLYEHGTLVPEDAPFYQFCLDNLGKLVDSTDCPANMELVELGTESEEEPAPSQEWIQRVREAARNN